MYRVYGYCFGEYFEVLAAEGCVARIYDANGVAVWGVDYIG